MSLIRIISELDYLECCGSVHVAVLETERAQNAELRKRIEGLSDLPHNGPEAASAAKAIPRPRGTAGTNFSIQESMGLSGTAKKYETYKAIQVSDSELLHPETHARSYSATSET